MNNRADAVSALLARGAALEARCDYQRTALIHCARERGGIATIRVLVEPGADVNAADKFGSNALELAAWRGKREVVDYLLEKGAGLPEPGEKWHGLLHMAASQGLETLFRPLAAKVRDLKARPAAQVPRIAGRLAEPREKRFNEIDRPFSRMRY